MREPVLIEGPAYEPVSLAELKLQLGFGPAEDSTRESSAILGDTLRPILLAARRECESFTRRVFVTQRYLLRMDGFPGKNWRYNWNGYPAIALPKPPFQSIEFVKYVDTFGAVQELPLDTTYGNSAPQYSYQMFRGSETAPGVVYTSWARPWPPTRMVPSNVMIQYRCGYGQPIIATIAKDSTALAVANGVTFNADDAPLMTGDTGLPISIPGAGLGGTTLKTFIASVDVNGAATLKDPAVTAVASVQGWAGNPVPEEIRNAIKLTAADYYENGVSAGQLPEAAVRSLKYYVNVVD